MNFAYPQRMLQQCDDSFLEDIRDRINAEITQRQRDPQRRQAVIDELRSIISVYGPTTPMSPYLLNRFNELLRMTAAYGISSDEWRDAPSVVYNED